jgi:hypothetical protein
MIHSSPHSNGFYYDEAPSFSFPRVSLLLSFLSSLVAWLALYLPWPPDTGITGIGIHTLDWARTAWPLATSVLLGLNVICSLTWLWHVTRLSSLLIWGIGACLSILMILLTIITLFHAPAVVGPWIYICALVGMLFCDLHVRRFYRLPEILTTPLGEETFRPPW